MTTEAPPGVGTGDIYIPLNFRLKAIESRLDNMERLIRVLFVVLAADLLTRLPDTVSFLLGVIK